MFSGPAFSSSFNELTMNDMVFRATSAPKRRAAGLWKGRRRAFRRRSPTCHMQRRHTTQGRRTGYHNAHLLTRAGASPAT